MPFRVSGYSLPLVGREGIEGSLYPHQAEIWDCWADTRDSTILLAAKTGTGKTRAAMLPLILNAESAVAVYPTNELLADQTQAICGIAESQNRNCLVYGPEFDSQEYAHADNILLPVDRRRLDAWQKHSRVKNRTQTVSRILNQTKPTIVLTNPDILFQVFALRYHAEALEHLRHYTTLVMDEFHLYQGVELAHALMFVKLARAFGAFRRVILLSATPDAEVRALLKNAFSPRVIEAAGSVEDSQPTRKAVHDVTVEPVEVGVKDPVNILTARILERRSSFKALRADNPETGYIPAVVIVNSVVNAIKLEDDLHQLGFPRSEMAIIRGLSSRAIRATEGKLIAIGTSAIEVGVDFDCDCLMFEASDAASFMQRFGRVGRHRVGQAVALVPTNAYSGMRQLPAELSREDFEERISHWYPALDSKSWFITTDFGMLTARTLCEMLLRVVRSDHGLDEQTEQDLAGLIEDTLSDHAARLGCALANDKARGTFQRFRRGKQGMKWLNAYCDLAQFRTSLPSLQVHDFTEQKRREGEWQGGEYDADLLTILKRGCNIKWNADKEKVTITGIGRLRRVSAGDTDIPERVILETDNYREGLQSLRLFQDDENVPVSDLMCRKNHIFVKVPRKAVEAHLDWRLPVVAAGAGHLIAFDGAALLLYEMATRAN